MQRLQAQEGKGKRGADLSLTRRLPLTPTMLHPRNTGSWSDPTGGQNKIISLLLSMNQT